MRACSHTGRPLRVKQERASWRRRSRDQQQGRQRRPRGPGAFRRFVGSSTRSSSGAARGRRSRWAQGLWVLVHWGRRVSIGHCRRSVRHSAGGAGGGDACVHLGGPPCYLLQRSCSHALTVCTPKHALPRPCKAPGSAPAARPKDHRRVEAFGCHGVLQLSSKPQPMRLLASQFFGRCLWRSVSCATWTDTARSYGLTPEPATRASGVTFLVAERA